jgi:hypothetical protein
MFIYLLNECTKSNLVYTSFLPVTSDEVYVLIYTKSSVTLKCDILQVDHRVNEIVTLRSKVDTMVGKRSVKSTITTVKKVKMNHELFDSMTYTEARVIAKGLQIKVKRGLAELIAHLKANTENHNPPKKQESSKTSNKVRNQVVPLKKRKRKAISVERTQDEPPTKESRVDSDQIDINQLRIIVILTVFLALC